MSILLDAIRDLAQAFGVLAAGTVRRPVGMGTGQRDSNPPVHLTNVMMAVLLPGNTAAREQLAVLGRDRARKLGYVAPDVDTKDGDIWEVDGEVYVVEGAEAIPDVRVCALSVYRRGA